MTEREWLDSTYLPTLVKYLTADTEPPDRKLRLFGVACCRRAAEWVMIPNAFGVIASIEAYAEDPSDPNPTRRYYRDFNRRWTNAPSRRESSDFESPELHLEFAIAAMLSEWPFTPHVDEVGQACADALCGHDDFDSNFGERLFQMDMFRDIFGNPFRPVAFDPRWQTSTAVGVAQTMYDARDFGAMPILADSLQDVGCEEDAILNHCRDAKQLHVRGCWVVDLVLGKS